MFLYREDNTGGSPIQPLFGDDFNALIVVRDSVNVLQTIKYRF